MFLNASSFNQDIGNWDVSNSQYFVSIIINKNVAMYEPTHITHITILHFLIVILFIYRIACLKEHCPLIKTLVIGMFHIVSAL